MHAGRCRRMVGSGATHKRPSDSAYIRYLQPGRTYIHCSHAELDYARVSAMQLSTGASQLLLVCHQVPSPQDHCK